MYLLDTDHISLIHRGGLDGQHILGRVRSVGQELIGVTIISYEEQMRGWMASIKSAGSIDLQRIQYAELARTLKYYCSAAIFLFDGAAVQTFQNLWLRRPRIGTMDLKIAAIALANNATLVTRNTSDFRKIPELMLDDWSI